MKAMIELHMKGTRPRRVKLTLPSRYQSEQFLSELATTLEDAEEVDRVHYQPGDGR